MLLYIVLWKRNYYTDQTIVEKYNMPPTNFILYKTLIGDNSDKVAGLKD